MSIMSDLDAALTEYMAAQSNQESDGDRDMSKETTTKQQVRQGRALGKLMEVYGDRDMSKETTTKQQVRQARALVDLDHALTEYMAAHNTDRPFPWTEETWATMEKLTTDTLARCNAVTPESK